MTTTVTFWAERGTRLEGFEDGIRPLMLLSTAKTDFLYACGEDHEKVMTITARALTAQGLSRDESVRKVNEFWGEPSRGGRCCTAAGSGGGRATTGPSS